MSDDNLSLFLKKITELEKICNDDKNNRQIIIGQINKIQNWLTGNRSLQHHRTLQKFFTYLWQSHGEEFKSRAGYVSYVKQKIGYSITKKIKTLEIKARCPHCNDWITEKAYLKEFISKSLSFSDCTQVMHQKVFDDVKAFAMREYKIDFDKWFIELSENEGTLQ